jgi:LuxR family transcriptional regulator, maltose regulon positive regulatory protein
MTDQWTATYGRSIIADRPNTDSKTGPRTTVSLTPAETRVLALLATYRTLAAIGTQLGIGRPTVKTHVANIYKKLGATRRADAVQLAESAGLLPRP